MAYKPNDAYARRARKEGYAARSAYKLEELDARFQLLRPGSHVLDLGASPGSWSQYASEKVGPKGRILGIDLQPITLVLPNAVFLLGDAEQTAWPELLATHGLRPRLDAVLSDMAPRTTGMRITDQARSLALGEMALAITLNTLRSGGHLALKLFEGPDVPEFRKSMAPYFRRVEVLRPKATQKESKEIFVVGLDFNKLE